MFQQSIASRRGWALACGLALAATTQANAADVAVFNASVYDSTGFAFDDFSFPGVVDTTGGFVSINVTTDQAAGNGLFGGAGSDVPAITDFDVADTELQVRFRVDPANVASAFRVSLIDVDGVGFTGDEHIYEFDISSVTPGSFVTLTNSMAAPLFTQGAFGFGPGDTIQNYGLKQIQVQSVFGVEDALVIDLDSIKIVDPDDPTIARLDAASYNASSSPFTFGSMSATGGADTSGSNIIIDAQLQAGGDFPGSSFGGIGFNLPGIDFDASQAEIVLNAKLLANNDSPTLRLQLSDGDPGGAGDDFVFTVDTADLNTTDFTEIVIPLGSGTESEVLTTFGLTPGDLLQNFGLIGMQIQAEGELATSRLNIEVESFLIREASTPSLPGDLDGDGFVGIDDLNLVLGNWNQNVPPANPLADPSGDGFIGIDDLNEVLGNWNAGTPPTGGAAVPEPGTLLILGACGVAALRRR